MYVWYGNGYCVYTYQMVSVTCTADHRYSATGRIHKGTMPYTYMDRTRARKGLATGATHHP